MKLFSFLIHCDFLGYKPTFSIGSKSTFQTFFGFLCSLIISGVISYFALTFLFDVITHQNPNIIVTTYFDEKIPEIEFNQTLITMTISLQNPDYSYYVDEKIYKLQVFAITQDVIENGNTERNETELQVSKCSDFLNFYLIPDYFSSLDLDNLYCLNPNTSTTLKGESGMKRWQYLQFRFRKCENSTEGKVSCYSAEEINEKLRGGYIGLFISHYSIVPNNYSHPMGIYGKHIFTSFSANYYSDIFVYLKTLEINTDKGLIINSYQSEKKISYSHYTAISDQRKSDSFLSLTIQMSSQRDVYERSYTKLQTVAGEIGGIMKVCLFAGEIIVYFFRSMLYQDYITSFFFEKQDNSFPIKTIYSNQFHTYNTTTIQNNCTNKFSKISNPNSKFKSNSCAWKLSEQGINSTANIDNEMLYNKNKKKQFNSNIQNSINRITIKNLLSKKGNSLLNNSLSEINTNNIIPQKLGVNNKSSKKHDTQKSQQILSPFWGQSSKGKNDNFCKKKELHLTEHHHKDIKIIKPKKAIRLWMLIGPCLCSKSIQTEIKGLKKRFVRIQFLFDALHYLKGHNDLLMLKRFTLKDKSYFDLFKTYNFELPKKDEMVLFYSSLRKKKRMKDFKQKVATNDHIRKSTTNSSIDIKLVGTNNLEKDFFTDIIN